MVQLHLTGFVRQCPDLSWRSRVVTATVTAAPSEEGEFTSDTQLSKFPLEKMFQHFLTPLFISLRDLFHQLPGLCCPSGDAG